MITIAKRLSGRATKENNYILVELRGLANDEKPTEIGSNKIENGSIFIEIDTGDVYLFDVTNQEWNKV